MDILSWILTFALSGGQLIRLSFLSGGVTGLDLLVIALSLAGLIKLKFRLKKPPFLKPALLFILVALVSLALSRLNLSGFEYLSAFSYTVRFSFYILLGWLIYSGAYTGIKKNLAKIFIYSGLIIGILGLLQIVVYPDLRFLTIYGWDPHYFRLVSAFLDPNFTSAYLVLSLILLISHERNKVFQIIGAIIFTALLLTFSRSGYLMFLTAGLSYSFLKKSVKLGILTLVLFALLLTGFGLYTRLVAEPRNIERGKSASFRLNTWQQGFEVFKNNPVFGTGFNAYRYAVRQLKLGDDEFLASHGSSGNDSSLLFVAATTGIIGLLTYIFLLVSLAQSGSRLIIIPALFGLIIHSFFSNSLFYPPILAWVIFNAAVPKK